jgi:hypothetical protein
MKRTLALSAGVIAALALLVACENLKPIGSRGSSSRGGGSTGGMAGAMAKPGMTKVELYIMSKCPYGVLAVQGIKPVLDEIGDKIDFHLDYIVNENNGQFGSLHGEPEVKGNIVQLCVMKHYPDMAKTMSFLDCWNKNWRAIPDGWEPCADQGQLDKGRIKSCAEGSEGKDLLRESMKRAQAANAGGSPTILVGGSPYEGERDKDAFMRGICGKITADRPAACAKVPPLPPEVEVSAIILTDKRCKTCQTAGLEANLKARFFPKLAAKTLDYGDEAGKALYKEMGIKLLPYMLFLDGVEKAPKYQQIARWMEPKGKYKMLKIPAQFDPTAEICDNNIDDDGNGKKDCEDDACKEDLVCRKEIPKLVQVFIMSQCPFGVQAVDAMKEVLENAKGKIKFETHYIAEKTPTGFNSLHGQPEVDENIRHLCAKKYYRAKNKWLDYIWCRDKDYRSAEWEKCAVDGIKADVIKKCSTGDEGKKLLEEDIKIAKALQVSGSPTWLANNKFKFSGIVANDIKTNICQHNKDLEGCDKTLTQKPAEGKPAGGACGQ